MKKIITILILFSATMGGNHVFAQSTEVYGKAADGYLNDKNFQAAYDNYSLAIKKAGRDNSKLAVLYAMRGLSLNGLQRMDEAIKDYNKSIELNPLLVDPYWNRGVAYDYFKKYDLAIADYEKAISLVKGDNTERPLSVLYCNIGWDEFWLKNFNSALKADSTSITLNSDYSRAFQLRGNIHYATNDYDLAADDYTKAIFSFKDNNPGLVSYLYSDRGDVKRDQKKYKDAINDYTQAINLLPKNRLAYWNRGAAYHENGDYKLATDDYTSAIGMYTDSINLSKLYDDKALNEMGQSMLHDAIRDDSIAIALAPGNINAVFNRANAYSQNGDYQQGVDLLRQLLDGNKSNVKLAAYLYYMIANDEYFLGQFDKVVSDCWKSIELDPGSPSSYFYRGKVYIKKMNNRDLAMKDFDKVLALDTTKKSVDYIFSLFYTGKGDEGAAILQNEILSTNNDAMLLADYYNLACIYSLMKKPDEANIYLKKAVDNGYAKKYIIADEDLDNIRSTNDYKSIIAVAAN